MWNWSQVHATELHWYVNTGPGNGLVLSSNKSYLSQCWHRLVLPRFLASHWYSAFRVHFMAHGPNKSYHKQTNSQDFMNFWLKPWVSPYGITRSVSNVTHFNFLLDPGRCGYNFSSVIFTHILMIDILIIFFEFALGESWWTSLMTSQHCFK